jgi:hypothetical protein
MGGQFSNCKVKNIQKLGTMNPKDQELKLVDNNDPKTTLNKKVAEGIELRIVECANVLTKMDNQFVKKGAQLLKISMVLEKNFVDYQFLEDYQADVIITGLEWNPKKKNEMRLKVLAKDYEDLQGGRAYINEGTPACGNMNYLRLTNSTCTLFPATQEYIKNNPNPKKELKNEFEFLDLDSDEEEDESHLMQTGGDTGYGSGPTQNNNRNRL